MRNARYAAVAVMFAAVLFLPHAARGLPASDDTPPIVSYSIDGIAGTNDWFRGSTHGNNITVRWSVSDPESPIISTTGCDPAIQIPGPDTGTTRTCEATSDGGTTRITTRSLKIDADPPTTTATPSRQPNGAGWFNAPFSISWPGSDDTSGIASCTGTLAYNGPQTTGATETGTCTDNAGNSSSDSFLVKYDTVPPDTNADPSRPPNGAGWFSAPFTVSWDGSDPGGSGIASCRTDLNYNGPDTNGTNVSGTCTDFAGNSSSDPFMVKYDTQAPTTVASVSRSPNGAGWYRSPLSITWSGSETGGSGIASCRPQLDFTGPDTSGTTVTGSCTDNAGNSSSDGVLLKYDSTPPSTQAAPTPAPNANGWFKAPLSVGWQGSDATSGIASCDSADDYNGPDTNGTSVSGSCTDRAGNSSPTTFVVKYDTHAPTTVASPSRPANGAGWYNAPLSITWAGSDPGGSGIDSCRAPLTYSGPDTTGAPSSGSCTDKAGNSSSDSFVVRYDGTGPTVDPPTPGRGPDQNGWYNRPVRIDWSGSDATSGIASCTSSTYGGPDNATAIASGSCTDVAGNVTGRNFALAYDATAPAVTVRPARNPDNNGWYNNSLGISWRGVDPVSGVASCTAPVTYTGPDSRTASAAGSCTDNAGNSAAGTLQFSYDDSPPTTVATPSRSPNADGWFKAPLSIAWSGSDPISGLASCSPSLAYNGPDTTGADKTGSCTDIAGNSSSATFRVKYDTTPPVTDAESTPASNANGWFNAPLSIAWSGTDGTSGIASCNSPVAYGGPDTNSTSVGGSCTDRAGNSSSDSFVVKYDTHAPVTVATPTPSPNGAGWYKAPLSISWAGSDPGGSGIDSCRTPLAYSGPDTTGTPRSGACTDKAGNSSSDDVVVKYDATAPSVNAPSPGRNPDHDGWYNHPVRIDWSGSDSTSGIASCTSRTYGGPDDANADPVGTCTDAAGNSASRDFSLEYDATGPTVAVTPARPADQAGWYNHAVSISWSGTDATSGIDSCTPTVTYSGPDSSNASSGGGCTDHAGNSASPPPLSFKYDATAPVTTIAPARLPDLNGWYNHPVAVGWRGTDRASGVASCSSLVYSGPDTGSDSRLGTCTDRAGNMSASVSWVVHYDSTAPGAIAAKPDRAPDHDGWYNHAVGIHWSGSDGLAGIASCSSLTYAGPGTAGGTLSGRCTDLAGNPSRPLPFGLSYDEDAPSLVALSLKGLDDAVALRWRATGASELKVTRSTGSSDTNSRDVYSGTGSTFTDRSVKNYVRYRYTLTAEDPAGNTVRRTASVMPLPVLYAPRGGAHLRVHARPLFAWKPAKRARYYNFQLWVDGHQAGSWWPSRARLRLPARWSYNGEPQRLERGTYTWYVWPGRGPRRLGRYGALLGKSSFVVG
jgi:hypothetical protein